MPKKQTTDKAQKRHERATGEQPKAITVAVEIPGWLALQLDKIATEYGLRGQDVVVLACMTLVGGVERNDPAWTNGLAKTKELLKR